MIRLLGRANSANVQKVMWCCAELSIPYERENYGGTFGKTNTDEYLALNPNGKVPTIVDGDLVLWESNTIVRYLSARHGVGTLWPEDAGARAATEKWMDWQLSVLSPALTPVRIGLLRTAPEQRDPEAIEAGRKKMSAAMKILDTHFTQTKFDYLTGDHLTMGDLPVGMIVWRWFTLDIKREPYEALHEWYQRIAARQTFQDNVVKQAGR